MGFLSPFLLSSLAALAVPLWLHLRRRRRQTPVEFPSLRYLKMAAARMKRQARVEDLGLLLLRLLLVALLAAAFARPVLRTAGGWLGAGRSVESVIVIDATAGSDAGIDVVSSEYATIAAEQTALENLSKQVADRIVTRLALQFRAPPK